MARLIICTWLWGDKYGHDYIQKLFAGVRRNLKQEYLPMVTTPQAEDRHLTEIKGCFARLRMFDPQWQAANGIEPGDRIVCMDLDLIVTGPLDALFDRPEPFVILQGANSVNPCPFNGSLWMLRAGYRPDVWHEFSLELAGKIPFHEFPDDQAWFADMMPDAAGWQAGRESGVYAFQKPGWPKGEQLPKDARIVAFPGWRDPSNYIRLDWVQEHWRT
ncbi:MAG: hypothetical protein EOS20_18640 [Mesorhizobium sp.]|uniref:hypothetical protein n=1 Tax=Mesorhizobium sp. TaxID=1871066 RepID=UPI000FE4ED71|nr:hypothetical protein [Mesorhizobium sp.]RWQ35524.1 MAG: hypothetical protein EOS20_18640 [Mesorhizobium sp.]RWQ38723.1 MAG: hypothetical protein EOS21_19495 [Mesorhizobium sp.]